MHDIHPTLESLGYDPYFRHAYEQAGWEHLEPGRIVEAHLERYTVRTGAGAYQADITGNLRHALEERCDFPTVGDWVAVATFDDGQAVVHHLLPRRSALMRKAASRRSEKQAIGANIDTALIMQAVEADYNLNRLDRYIAAAHGGHIAPAVILSKADLVAPEVLAARVGAIQERHPKVEVLTLSNLTSDGVDRLKARIEAGKTYCLLGSSGVGKSTLINTLLDTDLLATREISGWNQRGKHTTTHRALFVLPSGGIFIDTPGMRELAPAEGETGLEKAFEEVYALAAACRFGDCQHEDEPGCAVQAALQAGTLDPDKFENYGKMKRESAYFEASTAERHKKAKNQGKMYKRIMNEKHRWRS